MVGRATLFALIACTWACTADVEDGQFTCSDGECPPGFECCGPPGAGVCMRECTSSTCVEDTTVLGMVFVTRGQFRGDDLMGSCGAAAATAGLSGRFRAFVSDGAREARSEFPTMTIANRCGVYVANNSDMLWSGLGMPQFIVDEYGNTPTDWRVWTGTRASGDRADTHCQSWTSTLGTGMTGVTGTMDATWVEDTTQPCDMDAHIYCIRTER